MNGDDYSEPEEFAYPESVTRGFHIVDDQLGVGESVHLHGVKFTRAEGPSRYVAKVDDQPVDIIYPSRFASVQQFVRYAERLNNSHCGDRERYDPLRGDRS